MARRRIKTAVAAAFTTAAIALSAGGAAAGPYDPPPGGTYGGEFANKASCTDAGEQLVESHRARWFTCRGPYDGQLGNHPSLRYYVMWFGRV